MNNIDKCQTGQETKRERFITKIRNKRAIITNSTEIKRNTMISCISIS